MLKKGNQFKRNTVRVLTNIFIGKPSKKVTKPIDAIRVKSILLVRTNHRLGNLVLITPLLQEVSTIFPNARIDIIAQGGAAPILFKEYKNINQIILLPKKGLKKPLHYISQILKIKNKKYDISMNVVRGSSSGKLYTQMAKADYKLLNDEDKTALEKIKDFKHIAKMPVYRLRLFCERAGIDSNFSNVPKLDLKLTSDEILIGKQKLKEISKTDAPVICIYTFATGTKLYPKQWWETFYSELLQAFPGYTIIEMLPIENVSQIDFKALWFYSKDLREMAAIIENTSAFISVDGGVMHLAAATNATTIGLFNSPIISKYEPYGGANCAINTSEKNSKQVIDILKEKL
ncbi:glycosyltransferase family 9 protein [Patiriisocius hiemis]|uniref:Glycosyltransferase family 9 protein n=1 Tax=Patiriisocius hiemis TaxID=3075604 RepID=A0ABU2Y9Z5_9FLAO|nr:glycosyltransferase family 9 protein [Constantimarinum sp. W242]MDT0554847.1 glycosyltransferase family 9 protein [Constantimarinum sp. W242]